MRLLTSAFASSRSLFSGWQFKQYVSKKERGSKYREMSPCAGNVTCATGPFAATLGVGHYCDVSVDTRSL